MKNSFLVVASAVLIAGGGAVPGTAAEPATLAAPVVTLPCPDPEYVPALGRACRTATGWNVILRDGSTVHTHGPDPYPARATAETIGPAGGLAATPSDPYCVTSADYGVEVLYAVPSDKVNRYATVLTTIRQTVREVNGRINEAGVEAGNKVVDLRVVCDATGAIAVANEQLPTPSGADSFDTIVSDLQARGYSSTTKKYLVFYDDPAGACGVGSMYIDDSPGVNNAHNSGPLYAVAMEAFGSGCSGSGVALHELGHTMGAVQLTAPHTSGGLHCSDGADLMCYADDGSTACTTGGGNCHNSCFDHHHFDCGHDTYFHAAPPASNYLSTHWNIGSSVNRFLRFGGTAPSEWRQEAEAFASRTTGGQCSTSTGSAGLCWNIWSNGSISTTTTSLTAGTKRLSVAVLGDPAAGVWPQLEVYVDGTEVIDVAVDQDRWRWYSAALTLAAGTHTIELRFTNDGNVNGDDRNLLVDYAMVVPAARTWFQEAESFTTKTTGGFTPTPVASGGACWNIWSNGYIEHAMTVTHDSRHEIRVVARGEVAGGVWPQMKVYVGGTLVLTQSVNTTAWTTYRIRRSLDAGTYLLRIEFTNDGMVGTEDRNLRVDYAALDS